MSGEMNHDNTEDPISHGDYIFNFICLFILFVFIYLKEKNL